MSSMLTKLLALAGQVALQQLVYMEVGVLGELKRRSAMQEDRLSKKNKVRQTHVLAFTGQPGSCVTMFCGEKKSTEKQ